MRPTTTAITRTLKAELLYFHYSRSLLLVCVAMTVGTIIAFTGSVGEAESAHRSFVDLVQTYEANGVSLRDALAAPMTIDNQGDTETITNPLKYDYLQVGESVQAVAGIVPFAGTALDLVTFIFIPVTMIAVGLYAATRDQRCGTAKTRASRDRWADLVAGKLLALMIVSAIASLATVLAAAITAVVGAPLVDSATDGINYTLVTPETTSPLVAKFAVTTAIATFFGLVGYASGSAAGVVSWPLTIYALVFFLLPISWPWDPRNLIGVIGVQIYDFWGQFELRPPVEVGLFPAVLSLGALSGAALVLSFLLPTRRRRFR